MDFHFEAKHSDTAAALYDAGWRAEDRDDIAREYGYTDDDMHDLDCVCALLSYYEEKAKEKEDEE